VAEAYALFFALWHWWAYRVALTSTSMMA